MKKQEMELRILTLENESKTNRRLSYVALGIAIGAIMMGALNYQRTEDSFFRYEEDRRKREDFDKLISDNVGWIRRLTEDNVGYNRNPQQQW